ncbi:Kinesin-like protein KIF22, partial [Symbiodinium microadriaticum]
MDVVRSVMDGYNGTVMAYGQTGAGKTHTARSHGSKSEPPSHFVGFDFIQPTPQGVGRKLPDDRALTLRFDLLTDVGVAEQSGDLTIVEDARGNIQVRGLSTPVGGTEEE